jgi:hypothetical protein
MNTLNFFFKFTIFDQWCVSGLGGATIAAVVVVLIIVVLERMVQIAGQILSGKKWGSPFSSTKYYILTLSGL